MSEQSTSATALKESRAAIRGIKLKVLDVLRGAIGPLTASEVADYIPGHRINSINPRFAELAAADLIEFRGERRCNVTKKMALTWSPTGRPQKQAGRERAQSKTKVLRMEVEQWKAEATELRKECAAKTLELERLKARLARWGRPPKALQMERRAAAALQGFPCLIADCVRGCQHENEVQSAGHASSEGTRQAGDGITYSGSSGQTTGEASGDSDTRGNDGVNATGL